jgi:hypothetical protein
LKGHDFSRAVKRLNKIAALAAEGMQLVEKAFPQGLKPNNIIPSSCGTTKVVPFQNDNLPF